MAYSPETAGLREALYRKAAFETVAEMVWPNKLRLVGRVPPNSERNWLVVLYRLLAAAEQRPWNVDISKWYFIKKENGKVVQARRVIFDGTDLPKHYADIMNIISTSPMAQPDVIEIPLAGGANRNNPAGGKRGAAPTDRAVVGPMAMFQKQRGG